MIQTSYINKRGLAKNLKTTSSRLKIYSCVNNNYEKYRNLEFMHNAANNN